jgi:hypothetical protein
MPKFLSDSYAIAGGGAAPAFNCSCCGKTRKKTRTRKMKIFSLSFFFSFIMMTILHQGIASQRVRSSESFWFSNLGQRSLDEIQQRTLLCLLVDGVASGSGV